MSLKSTLCWPGLGHLGARRVLGVRGGQGREKVEEARAGPARRYLPGPN